MQLLSVARGYDREPVKEEIMTARRPALVAASLIVTLLVALIAIAIAADLVNAKSAAVIHKTALKGSSAFPAVKGEAKWKSKGGEREFEVQIEDAASLHSKRLTVKIGGTTIGKMTVGSLGRARLTRSTAAGQSVPRSVLGKTVLVLTAQGNLVARGTF
jgi:hypothetical protein